jgi:hypothetical protein
MPNMTHSGCIGPAPIAGQPAVRQDVDRRGFLGDLQGVMQRQQQHVGADPDLLGTRGRRGQNGQRR